MVAHLRKNEAYAELACGFGIGTSTVYRYIREGLDLLAATAPTLEEQLKRWDRIRQKPAVLTGKRWSVGACGLD